MGDFETYPTRFPIAANYVNDHGRDILYYLLTRDKGAAATVLGTAAACQAGETLLADMPYTSLYSKNGSGGACVAANLRGANVGPYYIDSQCQTSVDFVPTDYTEFCDQAVDNTILGNADVWDGTTQIVDRTPWTLTPGSQLDIGVLSINTNHQPFMQKRKYRTIGDCKLEMRVYKRDLKETNLKPAIAIHGGSWSYRGAAFYGLESQISHLTDKGFVVFAPFYRLTSHQDGNSECNGVTGEEITADITEAANWVKSHMGEYSASGKISVVGQSAGAHLAGYLAVHVSNDIEKAMLIYPPTDARDFIDEVNRGNMPDPLGLTALKKFLGDNSPTLDFTAVDVNSPLVINNSFPALVWNNPSQYPPMYIIHGASDELVPSRQSVRLCNALGRAGDLNFGPPAVNDGGNAAQGVYRKTYWCDSRGSRLDLIAEGKHMLDACLTPDIPELCFAGSSRSVDAVHDSLTYAWNWFAGRHPYPWLIPITSLLLN